MHGLSAGRDSIIGCRMVCRARLLSVAMVSVHWRFGRSLVWLLSVDMAVDEFHHLCHRRWGHRGIEAMKHQSQGHAWHYSIGGLHIGVGQQLEAEALVEGHTTGGELVGWGLDLEDDGQHAVADESLHYAAAYATSAQGGVDGKIFDIDEGVEVPVAEHGSLVGEGCIAWMLFAIVCGHRACIGIVSHEVHAWFVGCQLAEPGERAALVLGEGGEEESFYSWCHGYGLLCECKGGGRGDLMDIIRYNSFMALSSACSK